MASKNPLQIEIYTAYLSASRTGWRWRMWRSGHVVAAGPQAYVKRAHCRRTLLRLMATISKQSYIWKNGSEKHKLRDRD